MIVQRLFTDILDLNPDMEVCVLDESEASECLLVPVKEVRIVEGRVAIVIDSE